MADTGISAVKASLASNEAENLDDLVTQATAHYAQKDYKNAAELYSRATELQAESNGEMSPENANLLYLYGRCLYHVAVGKSDVLGSKVGDGKQDLPSKPATSEAPRKKSNGTIAEDRSAEEAVAAVATESIQTSAQQPKTQEAKPFFQFTGDENFDDSEEEEEEDGGGENAGDAAEEDDDFSNAFEILDLARVLLQKKLEELESKSRNPDEPREDEIKQLKERLADTHDLQAEISLEGEQFQNAVNDLRAALALKQSLYPPDSSLVAEIHYKLSLALEFASVTQQKGENGEVDQSKVAQVDEGMREEAAREMEAAIESCKLRIKKEEKALISGVNTGTNTKLKITQKGINDVKDMVQDMEQRLVELRQPPVSINDPKGTGTLDGATPLAGILGSILGESPEAQKARIEEATKEANDLTDLIKRKKPGEPVRGSSSQAGAGSSAGKRKVDFADEVEELGTGKKARVDGAGGS